MNNYPKRKSNRLKEYDYSQYGYYFITICTKGKECLFGRVVDGEMRLNEMGCIADEEIRNIPNHYDDVSVDAYVVMPNHVHLIIHITERINPFPTKTRGIPNIIGKYKAGVTRAVGKGFIPSASPKPIKLWQVSYHDHIIRNKKVYQKIYEYIKSNPLKWEEDCHNPINFKTNIRRR
ncbi:MAG: transposase [Defluviitaleaceae bacterium]|nr:transposase [Defluviitaleaceae bacterium]